ncbi:sugar transferase [Litorisediminicola beolgyonensis]|uniref:Sugar transferase n=1 Tax=Litorisediminicola beolgyonensis TaxID=1173614 RepID=A0ABW3ZHR7_9RHOB
MTLHLTPPCTEATRRELLGYAPTRGIRFALYRDCFKRAIDITLVLIAALPTLAILLPLCLLLAAQGASPFYSQRRVGLNGRIFRMWKLRSMVPNADVLLEAHLASDPAARAEWDRSQKLRFDPRITPLGRVIRKSSLDELPQLWNVLRGDMSIVGPRPMMIDQMDLYPGTAYYTLRPGVTGFWQTSVRNESSFADRAEYDTAYAKALSLRTDLAVMLRTVVVVIRGTGY